jgi:DNA-binding SARP family transcriptional activator/tetratricopeptide (TPR) repeat protein
MAPEMEFGLLGPLEVRRGGQVVPLRHGKLRALLAALLLRPGRTVPLDELARTLWWPGNPPPSAGVTIRNYVKRLRQALGDADRSRISTQPGGYLIRVADGELDVTRCEALMGAVRTAARNGEWDTVAARAGAALALWRGEPFADVPSELLAERALPRLADLRLQAVEARVGADLRLGRHAEVTAELQELVATHPLREQLQAQLMLALYRSGRRADALAAFRQARRMLVDELGAEPGTELRELHQHMLAADPALIIAVPAADPAPAAAGVVPPRELPGTAAHFTGREAELAALTGQLGELAGREASGTVVISAIGGTAGVGKTALAVRWAHQVSSQFPDGQLYVDMHGYAPADPVPATAALAAFLRALGVPGTDIPASEAERAARYRSVLAGRRVLVLLDNAGSAAQVRPLLPGVPGCMTLVTSRDSLAGLVVRDGARRVDLDLLPPADAVGLLRSLIGGRVDADPDAAAALADQCSRLPLALRVAAEFAAASPAAPLAELVTGLADQRRRLDLLDAGGDPSTAVRAVFSWSYRRLDAGAACAFRRVGLHPGPDFDRYAVAALTATTVAQAELDLAALLRAHLIQPASPGRYGLHDLLRAYARDLAEAEAEDGQDGADGAASVRAATTRLSDYYLHGAAAAMDTLFPAERDRRPRVPLPATPVPPLAAPAAARRWLDAELACLVAIAGREATPPDCTTRLATTLFRYLDTAGYLPEAVAIHGYARRAARRAGDRAAEADARTNLGVLDLRQGRLRQAATHFQAAQALFRAAGDQAGEVRALGNLGIVCLQEGRYDEAIRHLDEAITLFRRSGNHAGEARALASLAVIAVQRGQYGPAGDHLRRALAIFRESGDRTGEAHALASLGEIGIRQGQHEQAGHQLQRALTVFREIGSRSGEGRAFCVLGDLSMARGRYRAAADWQRQSLAISQATGDRTGEATALNGLGEALLAAGQAAEAGGQHAAALALTAGNGERYEQARAHRGLARRYDAGGDDGLAAYHWQQALALYTALGAPEAAQIRARLDGAGSRPAAPIG